MRYSKLNWPPMENLGELQLRVMGIPASGIRKLVLYFPKFPNLRLLNLFFGNIDHVEPGENEIPGSRILAQNLRYLKHLFWFSVYANYVNSDAIVVLVDSLVKNCPILEIALFGKNNFDGATINYALGKLFSRDPITNQSNLPRLTRVDFSHPPPGQFASPTAQNDLIRQVAEPFLFAPENFGRLGMTKFELPDQIKKEINRAVQSNKPGSFVVF